MIDAPAKPVVWPQNTSVPGECRTTPHVDLCGKACLTITRLSNHEGKKRERILVLGMAQPLRSGRLCRKLPDTTGTRPNKACFETTNGHGRIHIACPDGSHLYAPLLGPLREDEKAVPWCVSMRTLRPLGRSPGNRLAT